MLSKMNDYKLEIAKQAQQTKIPKRHRKLFDSAEKSTITINNNSAECFKWGNGPVVFFMHGAGGSTAQFGFMIEAMLDAGFRVISIDITSHGLSGNLAPPKVIGGYIIEIQKTEGEFAALIAHSMGCSWALWAMKFGLKSQSVFCLSPSATQNHFFDLFAAKFGYSDSEKEALNQQYCETYGDDWKEVYSNISLCKGISAQAFVYHDTDDKFIVFDEGGKKLVSHWPEAELNTTNGLGHFGLLRHMPSIKKIVSKISAMNCIPSNTQKLANYDN